MKKRTRAISSFSYLALQSVISAYVLAQATVNVTLDDGETPMRAGVDQA